MRTATATRQNGHDAHHGVGLAEPQCPYCGQPISRKAFKDIRSRIETEERARIAKIEQTLKTRFARERQEAAVATQQAIEKAKKDAAVQVEQAKREVAARAASIRQEATKSATAALAPKIAEAVAAEKQRALGERLALEQQLAAMQRRLEAKPPHQVGEPAEQDLHLRIAQLLPADQMTVSRVAKGVRGPDLFVEILEGGDVIGRIAIECKQHTRWSRKFITKLKTDSEDADFAILSSSVMPATANGSRLHIDQGVIVAHPTLVPALVTILRKQIVESYRLKLTTEHRDEKGQQLLDYIGSSEAADIFDRLHEAADGLINLELKEVDTHHSVWGKRAELIRTVQQVHENLMATIDRIIGAGK